MARYRILIADPLLGMGLQFPEGCSLAGQQEPGTAGTHWHLFDDPGAPEDLEGREVQLSMAREDGKPAITARRVILVHQVPSDDDADVFPCCGLPPYEMPPGDRADSDPALVTCGSAQ